MKPSECRALWNKALDAGCAAAEACKPVPMVVAEHVNPLNDNSPVKRAYYVPSGVCGFAGVRVKPANSKFGNWMKKNGIGRIDSYAGGIYFPIHSFGQSLEKKEACAYAMANVLSEAGIRAYGESRMD